MGAIRDGARRPERTPTIHDASHDVVYANTVEERIMLAGEGRTGEVLGGTRRTNGPSGASSVLGAPGRDLVDQSQGQRHRAQGRDDLDARLIDSGSIGSARRT